MAIFRSRFAGHLAILTLLVVIAEAQASSKPSEAELAAITARGVLLAEYDTAAWQATDAVQAAHPVEGRVDHESCWSRQLLRVSQSTKSTRNSLSKSKRIRDGRPDCWDEGAP